MTHPLDLFETWFAAAQAAKVPQPETMALATALPDGRPSVRFVLYRGRSPDGIRFFTNYESRKADELAANPVAAIAFYWHEIARQVRMEGAVHRLTPAESDAYFAARPRGSQLGAWASPQSRPFAFTELVARHVELEREYEGRAVPRPPHWGGYLLVPSRVEFWEGGDSRLHRRTLYTREHHAWTSGELAP